jgi:hypothetical protein
MTTLPDLSFLDDVGNDDCLHGPQLGLTPANLPPYWYVLWDERAAVMEYDGGIPREQAEHLALLDVLKNRDRAGDPRG